MLHKLRVDLLTLHLSSWVAYSILSKRLVAARLAIRAMSTSNSVADKSAAPRELLHPARALHGAPPTPKPPPTSNLRLATRGLSRGMTNTVPVPDPTDPTDLSRASRGLSRGMTNTVPVPDPTDPTDLSRAS